MQKLLNLINTTYRTERNITILFIVTRFLLVAIGLLAVGDVSIAGLKEGWVNWDGYLYMDVVNHGYDSSYSEFEPEAAECNRSTGECQRNFAFFPVYPMVVGGVSVLTTLSPENSGFLISNLCLLISAILLYHIGRRLFNEQAGSIAAYLLLVFPTSYIFSGVMTESLFLMLLLAGYFALLKNQYLLAGLLGLLLSATRNTGVLFAGVIVLHWLSSQDFNWKQIRRTLNYVRLDLIISVFLVPLGLLAFMIFLDNRVGDPLAFLNIQRYWEKPVLGLNPLLAIPFSFIDYRLEGLFIHVYNLCYFVLLAVLGIYAYWKKLLPMSLLFIMTWIFVPLTAGSMLALPRYMSVLFPLYLVLAKLIADRKNKWLSMLALAASMCVLCALTYLYTRGNWITV